MVSQRTRLSSENKRHFACLHGCAEPRRAVTFSDTPSLSRPLEAEREVVSIIDRHPGLGGRGDPGKPLTAFAVIFMRAPFFAAGRRVYRSYGSRRIWRHCGHD